MLIMLITVIVLIAVAVLLLGVKALFVKGGEFPSGHVHDLPRRRREALSRLTKRNNNSQEKKDTIE